MKIGHKRIGSPRDLFGAEEADFLLGWSSLFPSVSHLPSGILFGCRFIHPSLDKHFPEEQSEEVAHAAGEDGVRQGQRGPVEKGHLIQSEIEDKVKLIIVNL